VGTIIDTIKLMIKQTLKYFSIVFLLSSLMPNTGMASFDMHYSAAKGTIDLSSWSPEKDKIVILEGEWAFYPGKFIDPSFIDPGLYDHFILCPNIWNNYVQNNKKFGGHNYATYCLTIDLPGKNRYYTLKIPEMATAYRLFIDGKEYASNGKPGIDKNSSIPAYRPMEVPFYSQRHRTNLVLHISNYHHVKGGMWDPILISTPQKIRRYALFHQLYEIFLMGGLFLIGVNHLMLYWRRKSESAALYLSLFCFTIAARTLVVGEHLLVQAFPSLPWILYVTIEYATFPLAIIFCAFYLGEVFHDSINQKIIRAISAISLLYFLVIVTASPDIFIPLLLYFQYAPVITLLYIIPFLFLAMIRKIPYAVIIGTGMICVTISFAYEFMYVNQLIFVVNVINATSLGLIVLVMCQAYVLADRFSQAFESSESLFREMEKKIESRTMELSSTLTLMNENLEFAGMIQQALLPKFNPSSSQYKTAAICVPAEILAGDFYNFHVFRGGGLGIFVADVTGHGIASALIASMVNILFSTGRSDAGSPAIFLKTMNDELTGNIENQFITACYAYLDDSARNVTFVRAGHEPVLIYNRKQNMVSRYQPRGMLMGYEKGNEYEEMTIPVNPGDRVFLYTDCIIEIRNQQGDDFGTDRLEDFILRNQKTSIEDILQLIIGELEGWSNRHAPFHDDLTMVILEIL